MLEPLSAGQVPPSGRSPLKRCVTNVGASGLTNKKNTNYYFIQLHHSLDLELDRAPPTSCVCTHEYLLRIPGRWCGSMAVPYSQSRTRCGPWPYCIRILKTSSRTSLRMNARACTPRAEFSDLEKYGAAFAKVPKLEVSRSPIHTEITYYVTPPPRCTSPT